MQAIKEILDAAMRGEGVVITVHGRPSDLCKQQGLDAESIAKTVLLELVGL